MDYKEYSRLRSIARKRIERAAAAGRGELIKLPTVKELRQTATNPEAFLSAIKNFLSDPASSLKASRATGERVQIQLPEKKLTPEEARKQRRREQKRRSKAKRAVERAAGSEQNARKKVGFLKALETMSEKWQKAGMEIGQQLGILSPKKAKQFVDYMEYRFSQGDYKNRYAIDTFIRDFGELTRKGYDFNDIKGDFDAFLGKQKELKKNKRNTNKYGITEDEIDLAWRIFIKG